MSFLTLLAIFEFEPTAICHCESHEAIYFRYRLLRRQTSRNDSFIAILRIEIPVLLHRTFQYVSVRASFRTEISSTLRRYSWLVVSR